MSDYPVDLAARLLGGAVQAASDESFGAKEHLLLPGPPAPPGGYGVRGRVYDGWETRRRRGGEAVASASSDTSSDTSSDGSSYDWAVIRLGAPGVVHRVVVDTTHFAGNHPARVTVWGTRADPGLTPARAGRLAGRSAAWTLLGGLEPVAPDAPNVLDVDDPHRWTHLRLDIHPDGGVARVRAYGEAVPDPALVEAWEVVDLVALEHGGRVTAASNGHYGSPGWLLAPGPPRDMGEGWETARRRSPGHEWVRIRLGLPGRIRVLEIDTTCYLHNAPGEVEVVTETGQPLLARTGLPADTRTRFLVDGVAEELTVRIHPDGGLARLRAWGAPTPAGLAGLRRRWEQTGGPVVTAP